MNLPTKTESHLEVNDYYWATDFQDDDDIWSQEKDKLTDNNWVLVLKLPTTNERFLSVENTILNMQAEDPTIEAVREAAE